MTMMICIPVQSVRGHPWLRSASTGYIIPATTKSLRVHPSTDRQRSFTFSCSMHRVQKKAPLYVWLELCRILAIFEILSPADRLGTTFYVA